jgi:branched-chain amino acid transport system ATP-binding protein
MLRRTPAGQSARKRATRADVNRREACSGQQICRLQALRSSSPLPEFRLPEFPLPEFPLPEKTMSALAITPVAATQPSILSVKNIEVIYDHVILVLKGVSVDVPQGGIVAILGGNGAGKSTTLKAVSNLLRSERGEVTKGQIDFKGERVDKLTPNELVRRGCIQVMEGRHCFGHLTIEENLLTGAFTRRDGNAAIKAELERVYTYFPRLRERRTSQAGYTSGGEQQMCAIGRALMAKPTMILLDEPSMGLAPQIVEQIFEIVKDINAKEGVSFLLAEQNTNVALRYATHGYIMETGRIVMEGDAKSLRENEDVKEFYLGAAGTSRKSFRDVKSYKRRKRWLT